MLVAVVLAIIAACDSGGDSNQAYGYDSCNQLRWCGTCTPVQGCGWCTFADGTGACVADPSECDTAPTFTWAWNPAGCRTGADASVVEGDGGGARVGDAAGPGDAAGASADAPTADGG